MYRFQTLGDGRLLVLAESIESNDFSRFATCMLGRLSCRLIQALPSCTAISVHLLETYVLCRSTCLCRNLSSGPGVVASVRVRCLPELQSENPTLSCSSFFFSLTFFFFSGTRCTLNCTITSAGASEQARPRAKGPLQGPSPSEGAGNGM